MLKLRMKKVAEINYNEAIGGLESIIKDVVLSNYKLSDSAESILKNEDLKLALEKSGLDAEGLIGEIDIAVQSLDVLKNRLEDALKKIQDEQ
ncbi:hypothetical protein D3C81_965430 [compost metagenome]